MPNRPLLRRNACRQLPIVTPRQPCNARKHPPVVEARPTKQIAAELVRRQDHLGLSALVEGLPDATLDLSRCLLDWRDAQFVGDWMRDGGQPSALDMSRTRVGHPGAEAIATAVSVNTSLRSLTMSHAGLSDDSFGTLASSLAGNRSIRELALSATFDAGPGVERLLRVLRAGGTVASLSLAGIVMRETSARLIGKLLARTSSVTRLDLGACAGPTLTDAVARGLEANCSLKWLSLQWNLMARTGSERLARALKTHHALEHLDLSDNRIDTTGMRALAASLSDHPGLRCLVLAGNSLSPEAMFSLANALKRNGRLQTLDLSAMQISDEMAIQLCRSLEGNDSLKHLKLSHNPLGPSGVAALLRLMHRNPSLVSYDLSHCNLPSSDIQTLVSTLAQHPHIVRMNLSGNPGAARRRDALASALTRNRMHRMLGSCSTSFQAALNGRPGSLHVPHELVAHILSQLPNDASGSTGMESLMMLTRG